MSVDIKTWKHVFKLDPDRVISDDHLEQICLSGTDAIMVGGSTGVTYDNTVQLLSRIRRYELPCVLEISNLEAVVPGFDLYLVPVVMNTSQVDWIIGIHHQAMKTYGGIIHWPQIVVEGYVILNADASVAQLTHAITDLDQKDILAYARMVDQLFQMPILYIEYSGRFGDMEMLSQTKQVLVQAQLFYGGGIDHLEKAKLASSIADTIVVGNAIYTDFVQALETVKCKGK